MKIRPSDYQRLSALVTSFVVDRGIGKRAAYPGMSIERYVWAVFHAAMDGAQADNRIEHYLFFRSLWDYLDDNNITTALKSILKERL